MYCIFLHPPMYLYYRAFWSLLDGIWGLLKGSWGVLVVMLLRFVM